jgi:hypothetical protein
VKISPLHVDILASFRIFSSSHTKLSLSFLSIPLCQLKLAVVVFHNVVLVGDPTSNFVLSFGRRVR